MTEECKDKEGKPINYILNEDNPALYVSIDPRHPFKSFNKRLGKVDHTKLFGNIAESGSGHIDILQVRDILCPSKGAFTRARNLAGPDGQQAVAAAALQRDF